MIVKSKALCRYFPPGAPLRVSRHYRGESFHVVLAGGGEQQPRLSFVSLRKKIFSIRTTGKQSEATGGNSLKLVQGNKGKKENSTLGGGAGMHADPSVMSGKGATTLEKATPQCPKLMSAFSRSLIRTSENGLSPTHRLHTSRHRVKITPKTAGRAARGRCSLGSRAKAGPKPSGKMKKSQAENRPWQKPSCKLVHTVNRSYH